MKVHLHQATSGVCSLEETKPKPIRKYIVFAYKKLNLSLFISGCLLGGGGGEAGKEWGVGRISRMQQIVQRTQLLKIKIKTLLICMVNYLACISQGLSFPDRFRQNKNSSSRNIVPNTSARTSVGGLDIESAWGAG